jgi:hypothetical protein
MAFIKECCCVKLGAGFLFVFKVRSTGKCKCHLKQDGGNAKRLFGTIFANHVGNAEDGQADKCSE